MKVCIPAMDEKGLEGTPHGHFGSCSHFVIHDIDTGATDIIGNGDGSHEHGMCHPLPRSRAGASTRSSSAASA